MAVWGRFSNSERNVELFHSNSSGIRWVYIGVGSDRWRDPPELIASLILFFRLSL